jgi:PAS domain S-box-containing protein
LQTLQKTGLVLLCIFALSVLWEFVLEDFLSGVLNAEDTIESTWEHWHYVIEVVIFSAITLAVFNLWPSSEDAPQEKAEASGAIPFLAFVLTATIALSSWGVLSHIESDAKKNIKKSLDATLEMTHAAIQNLFTNQKSAAILWARNSQIRAATKQLSSLPKTQKILIESPAQENLRSWLKPVFRTLGYRGFFVIGKGNVNLASTRDSNVGEVNLLSKQEDFLKRIWAGETLMSLPQTSEVPLKDYTGKMVENLATMFVASPIRDANGNVAAVLSFRLEPDEIFGPIFKRGRSGDTGEAYAFNKKGLLISESRFNEQLKKIGVISKDDHSDLNVELRDPGVNLTLGEPPRLPKNEQPLTFMAERATSGKDGANLEGYRDYRGVPVIGSWLWNDEIGLGIATEIDAKEAFASLNETRLIINIFTALSIGVLIILASVSATSSRMITTSEDKFRRLVETTRTVAWELDLASFCYTYVSPQAFVIFGYPIEDWHRENFFVDNLHPEDRNWALEFFKKATARGEDHEFEYRMIASDGRIVWVRDIVKVISKNGVPISLRGTLVDITDLKKTEETLRKLSYAVDQSANMLFITDTGRAIEYVNSKFEEVTGYTNDETIGKNPHILHSNETPPEVYEEMWKALEAGEEWRGEIKDRRKDGSHFWASAIVSPIKDANGVITNYVFTHEDISQRKDAEFAIQTALDHAAVANRSKSELMANMSHELRTPLNAIIGFSSGLRDGIFGPLANNKQKEYINDIHDSGEHLLDLINDILDVSAIEAGKLELFEEGVDIKDVSVSALRIITHRAEVGKVNISSKIDKDIPMLYADKRRVKQILLNLLSNAVKFTPQKGQVSLSASLDQKGALTFTVADTGIGMDKIELAKALTEFGQVDSGLSRKHEGTGLGLPLARGLAELHGGTLEITSEKGVGTTATMRFPPERIIRNASAIE